MVKTMVSCRFSLKPIQFCTCVHHFRYIFDGQKLHDVTISRYRQRQQGAGDRVSGFLGQAAKSYAGNFKDEDHTEAEIAWDLLSEINGTDLDGGFKHGLRTFSILYMGCHPYPIDELIFFKMVIAPPTRYLWQRLDILWMEDILHHLTDGWNPMNNGINHLSTGAGFLPSTVLSWYLEVGITSIMIQGHNLFGAPYSKVLALKLLLNPKSGRIGMGMGCEDLCFWGAWSHFRMIKFCSAKHFNCVLEIFHPQFDHGSHRGQGPDLGGHKKAMESPGVAGWNYQIPGGRTIH